MSGEAKTVATNKSQGEECRVPCRNCHVETRHKVLQSVEVSEEDSSPNFYYWYADSYQIVQCQGCDDVSFRKVHTNSEDIDYDPETGEQSLDATIDVYPSCVTGRHKLRQAQFLPFEVSRIYLVFTTKRTQHFVINSRYLPVSVSEHSSNLYVRRNKPPKRL